jgi:hypothetical protein
VQLTIYRIQGGARGPKFVNRLVCINPVSVVAYWNCAQRLSTATSSAAGIRKHLKRNYLLQKEAEPLRGITRFVKKQHHGVEVARFARTQGIFQGRSSDLRTGGLLESEALARARSTGTV